MPCVLVCPRCGDAWARRSDAHQGFSTRPATCAKCPITWPDEIPGSIADGAEVHFDGHGCKHFTQAELVQEFTLLADVDTGELCAHNSPTKEHPMPEAVIERIAELRSKVASNTITPEELREGIKLLRANRLGAATRREAKATKAAPIDGAALLARLMGGVPK